jgi:hypothetical protein
MRFLMLSRLSPLFVILLAIAGCKKNPDNDQPAVKSSLLSGPVVALVPVIDNTRSEGYAWSLSDEFTSSIYSCLSQGTLHLEHLGKARELAKKSKDNPFGTNISWIKKTFEKEQFVVFLELIDHEEILKQDKTALTDPKTCGADLKMGMRVRAFDLRGEEPRVILQELVHDSHFIPRPFTRINFQQAPWGDDSFAFSPLGLAHWEFSKQIASRIEDYIRMTLCPL